MRRLPALGKSASASSSTGRRASRPTCATCSARRRSCRRLYRRRRVQLDRHPVGRRRRQGAGRVDRRRPSADGPLGRRHPPPAAVPGQQALPAGARHRVARPALRDALAATGSTRPRATCGSRRCTSGSPERGACFGETAGWERANWFAPTGVKPDYRYSYGRQNWFALFGRGASRRCARRVALFDMTSFGKFLVKGAGRRGGAAADLRQRRGGRARPRRLHAVAQRARRHRGRSDRDAAGRTGFLVVTAARHGAPRSRLAASATSRRRATCASPTSPRPRRCSCVMGPNCARAAAKRCRAPICRTPRYPFGTSREIEIGYALVRAARITYVGELGWELYVADRICARRVRRVADGGRRRIRPQACRPACAGFAAGSRRPIAIGATTSATRTRRSRPA